MIDFLKRLKKQTDEQSREEKFSQIEIGSILMFNPTAQSHELDPYYVCVVDKGSNYFVTAIPDEHELLIGGSNFNYHLDRCEIIGNIKTHGSLLYNQKLISKCGRGGNKPARKITI